MRAIDANILVRFLTNDDAEQAAAARAVVEGGPCFVARTVMLETDWVLRSVYGISRTESVRALRAFAGLPGVIVEDAQLVADALDRADQGMDFADALHLGAAAACATFVTFDQKFIRKAAELAIRPTVAKPEPAT